MRAIDNGNSNLSGARTRKPLASRRGFTLIELLVVIAVTSILLTLVFKPLIDGFNLTSRSGTQIESQTAARETLREVTTLLNNAAFIFDNSDQGSSTKSGSANYLWFNDKDGNPKPLTTYFTLLEYVPPARQLDQTPGATATDPTTGMPIYDKTNTVASGYALPLVPGRLLGRLFVGLSDNTSVNTALKDIDGNTVKSMPSKVYANRFTEPGNASNDNRYTLYRAEVMPYIQQSGKYVPNLGLFHTRDKTGKLTDSVTDTLELHDPNFFYDNSLAGGDGASKWALPGWRDLNNDGKVEIWENWRAVASSLMPLPKVDLVALERDDNNHITYYTSDDNVKSYLVGMPKVRPLATFSPSYIENDPGTPTALENSGNEATSLISDSGKPVPFPASSYTTQYTNWATPFRVTVYRALDSLDTDPIAPGTNKSLNYYQTTGDGQVIHYTGQPGQNGTPDGQGDVGPMLVNGVFSNAAKTQFAFTVDSKRGLINFAFPWSVMVHDTNNQPVPQLYSAIDINAAVTGPTEKRYLDLRTLPNQTGLVSPLNPNANWAPYVRIVPGSERVYGPDQRPGPHYGYRILYTRVSAMAGTIGPNEYKINYEDVRNVADVDDPRQRIGFVEFRSTSENSSSTGQGTNSSPNMGDYDPNKPNDPANENPALGQYRPFGLPQAKYDPATDQVVPADPVEVTYSFQMNRPNDIIKVDYLTRQQMTVALEARLYDPASSAAQTTALTQKIAVRNLPH